MVLRMNLARRETWVKNCGALLAAALFIVLSMPGTSLPATGEQKTFAAPEEAVKALVEALKANDVKALEAIFGPYPKSGLLVALRC